MPKKYIQRITLDLDGYKGKTGIKYIDNIITDHVCKKLYRKLKEKITPKLKSIGFKVICGNISASKRGMHVIAWHNEGFPKKKLLELRMLLGDDKMRIFLDSKTGRHINVLFDKKQIIKRKK